MKEQRTLEEEALDRKLEEYVKAFLKMDDLEGMVARNVDGAFNEGDGGEGAAKLVDLDVMSIVETQMIL